MRSRPSSIELGKRRLRRPEVRRRASSDYSNHLWIRGTFIRTATIRPAFFLCLGQLYLPQSGASTPALPSRVSSSPALPAARALAFFGGPVVL